MEKYANNGGDSGIVSFDIGEDYVAVAFKGGGPYYKYTDANCGKNHIDTMKGLARAGQGLHSYIMNNCKTCYEK